MAGEARRLWTNFSKGELSPRIEGRPDLAAYFEGCKDINNFVLLRQGGVQRRIGTRFVAEVKDQSKDTILLPFEVSVDQAYIVEVGQSYMRFFKNKAPIMSGGIPVEVVGPYHEHHLRNIHFTQSVDVLFLFHPDVRQQTLSHVNDLTWVLSDVVYNPPPSFEADTDISNGKQLIPGATAGGNVLFTATGPVFLSSDVGRQIIVGASRAIIIGLGASSGDFTEPNTHVRADILDAFISTVAIDSGSWFLRLSPQSVLDPDKKGPVGAQITLTADRASFRNEDVHKFIHIFNGLVRITQVQSSTVIIGEILNVLETTAEDPPAAPVGGWTMEETSWSDANGYPRTGEFFQGRLGQASTRAQPTTFWLSVSNEFDNYALGAKSDDAIEYTIASRQLNRIEWLADNDDLFPCTSGSELVATSGKSDEPFGGDIVPKISRISTNGSAPIQPVLIGSRLIFVDRSQKQIFSLVFDFELNKFNPIELTAAAEHITTDGVRLGPIAFQKRPDPRIYFVLKDGDLLALTYFVNEKVIGFTKIHTNGSFEAVACIPQSAGKPDQVWVIVARSFGSVVKHYIEVFDDDAEELDGRAWKELHTDCAKLYDLHGIGRTVLTGLEHLEGRKVAIVADGSIRPEATVVGGMITLQEPAFEHVEVGIPYNSALDTMRPAVEGKMIEGLPRNWISISVRLLKTIGGRLQNLELLYPFSATNVIDIFTGDVQVTPEQNYDTDGRIRITQEQPYPMTILALFGELVVGDHN